jgi:putative ABC transport system substrate-binding protein
MRRREFIAFLGSGIAGWPLAARAQQAAKLPVIGFFSAGSPAGMRNWVAALVQRLRELGWIEGRTVAIESSPVAGTARRSVAVPARSASQSPQSLR